MVPGFHGVDLIVILIIALLIFGPKKLPEMGSAIGKSIKEFKKGMNELTAAKEEEPKSPTLASYEALERELASRRALDEANARDLANKKVGSSETSSSENVYTERQAE
jgi:sec-independent protein translocase protein TatA